MPLINCKVELKLKWTKYCVLASNSTDNIDTDCYKLFLLSKTQKVICTCSRIIGRRASKTIKTS